MFFFPCTKVHIPNPTPKLEKQGTIWESLQRTSLDMQKFEALFESKTAENKAKVCIAAECVVMFL